jgi:hypothetical protein
VTDAIEVEKVQPASGAGVHRVWLQDRMVRWHPNP